MEENKNKLEPFVPDLNSRTQGEIDALLASQRTGMSFQRTRLSTDRTLMAVIRTALSLISFGFTIFQFFQKSHFKSHIQEKFQTHAPKYFGFSLTGLGIMILVLGIIYHLKIMHQIREERTTLMKHHLLPTIDKFPISMTLIIALLLLLIGLIAFATMLLQSIGFQL